MLLWDWNTRPSTPSSASAHSGVRKRRTTHRQSRQSRGVRVVLLGHRRMTKMNNALAWESPIQLVDRI